jgi:hypothetical protein
VVTCEIGIPLGHVLLNGPEESNVFLRFVLRIGRRPWVARRWKEERKNQVLSERRSIADHQTVGVRRAGRKKSIESGNASVENWRRHEEILETCLSVDLEIYISQPRAQVLPFEREQPSKFRRCNTGSNQTEKVAADRSDDETLREGGA